MPDKPCMRQATCMFTVLIVDTESAGSLSRVLDTYCGVPKFGLGSEESNAYLSR